MPKKSLFLASIGIAACLALAGCGTTSNGTANSANTTSANSTGTTAGAKGTADVAYAGSLQLTNDQYVAPAFEKATGLAYKGYGQGADAVANLIKSGQITPNVFDSIGTGPIEKVGTDKADWAIGFASSPLVIVYSKQSPYASQLEQIANGTKPLKDLFTLMEQPNFHLGRTDPNQDPQGQYFVMMLHLAEKQFNLPAGTANKILGSLDNSQQVYQETDILSRLQAGEMDASSAYLPQAIQQHLPYIKLPDTINMGNPADAKLYASESLKLSDGSTVTGSPIEIYVTGIKGTPDQSAGTAFIKFALSKQGLAIYRKMGYTITPFQVWGNKSDIPQSIEQEITG
ncbi:substrate-binding domain-containing protein [Alicyclobacillus cycloheptanicus]|uniref:Molybdate/tungstate transport system substrate-binding protein n=1 Tax=Alicyclobacillus cycloheptanicus TaxID=1457 RepID=A0ABT9XLY1_9BACL|nr:extracellular solute-binding protein [Alicyclobacillus cycloheptanicus]MDQ0191295.1 molybdate/tungstate transport system substrate-binding protein [Alicyclobacillus cycloheptanicus]WDM02415.1 substrate-binding domain-containing protein [Alicyclobacillus cycloheptanicus]